MIDERRSERSWKLPGWAATLICIAALAALYYGFQGINDLIAPTKFTPCGTIGCHPAKPTGTTIPIVTPLTTTPTTAQIVPLPANPNTPSNTPQPSFAPAP